MDFELQLTNLRNDTYVMEYFEHKNIYEFIKTYIKVDLLVNSNVKDCDFKQENNKLMDQLYEIKRTIKELNIKSQLQQLQECLTNTTNNDIKKILYELNGSNDKSVKQTFENLKDTLVNLNSKNLNDIDRRTLSVIQDIKSSFDNHPKLNSIDTTLNLLHNTFTNNSSKKGEIAENILYSNMIKAFPSSEITNTSQKANSGDIMIKKEGKPDILIDSKHFQTNVPKLDLEKFLKDCELNNCCGILCNVNNGIANKEHFQVDIQDSRIYVYISNHEFDNTLFQLATRIIYNIYDIIKSNKTNIIEIDKELFERIKIEYNFFIQSFKQHLNIIKQNVNSLEQLGMVQLEQFFKRSNFNDLKPFPCSSCGAGFGSSKTLKKHMKDKHNISVTNKRKTKEKVEIEEVEDIEENVKEVEEKNEGTVNISLIRDNVREF